MVGKFIQKQREKLALSQNYVATKLGISRPTYISIEQGKRELTLSEAKTLSRLLNITVTELLAEKVNPEIEVEVVDYQNTDKKAQTPLRISIPKQDVEKFKEVFLYVLSQVGAKPNVGETVLYKLLYFIDFDYYEKYEEQLIGATYIKNHFGPTPVEFKKLTDDMAAAGELEAIKSKYFQHEQKKYLAVRQPDLSKLVSAQELQHIDEVLARLAGKNATELSHYSHADVPWIVTDEGEPIDYELVFYRTPKTSVRNYAEDQL